MISNGKESCRRYYVYLYHIDRKSALVPLYMDLSETDRINAIDNLRKPGRLSPKWKFTGYSIIR